MSNQKMFRSALSGYNREDVNTYIKDTDTRHYEEVEALKIETESLRTKLNDEVMKAEALEEEKKIRYQRVIIAPRKRNQIR